MKTAIFLLLCCILVSAYVVDNSSIIVGITGPNWYYGAATEMNNLKNTISNLGFGYYQSASGNGSDFEAHGCQVVYNGCYTYEVTGWDWRMSGQGRGYIQQGGWSDCCWCYYMPWGWITWMASPSDTCHVYRYGNNELLNFPNLMPLGWLAKGYHISYTPSSYTLMEGYHYSDAPTFDIHAEVENPEDPPGRLKNSLLSRQTGKGRGLFCGWLIYGPEASSYDKNLFENLIIYAAQPPKAEAGEIYSAPVGVPVTLDASDSTDDQMIVLYQWDIDNDGIYEISTPNPIAQWTWQQPYNGDIELRVKDNLNCQSCDWAYRADRLCGCEPRYGGNYQITVPSIKEKAMKTAIFLLLCCILVSAYVVDNSSIKVGISVPNTYDGAGSQVLQLKNTLTNLGFSYYQSFTANGSDYEAHGCQVVYNNRFTYPVTGWDWRMSLDGRGYIQQACYGEPVWPYFGGGYEFYCGYPAVTLHVYREGNCELLNFPNLMPAGWLAHANNYGYDPVSHVLFLAGATSFCPQHLRIMLQWKM